MSKQLTFTAPVQVPYSPPPEMLDAVRASVSSRIIETDADGNTTIKATVELFDGDGNSCGHLGPFREDLPPTWQAEVDAMDAKILAYVKARTGPDPASTAEVPLGPITPFDGNVS